MPDGPGAADAGQLAERLLKRDLTLWPKGSEAKDRLGWLDVVRRMQAEAEDLMAWAGTIDASRVVLCGMGGSSLGPEVLRSATRNERLYVLDTTDPKTVASVDLNDAFILVSSKSGGTLEPNALFAHCWERIPDGSRYAAITDPGSSLGQLASDHDFNRTFENPPDIGGRYSVLSYFGLVPAALMGIDVAHLCQRALETHVTNAVQLGIDIGSAAKEGRDKVTIKVPPGPMGAFGLWVEQLIAESTGKEGRGCVPVPTTEAEEGSDRFEVAVHVGDPYDLGEEFMRWELATAVVGHILDIDPFNQPNVTESKENTGRVLESLPLPEDPTVDFDELEPWLAMNVGAGDYISIQAYLPYGNDANLEKLRRNLRDANGGVAVTAGYGPRFLHSTGQLHKGGPNSVVSVQLVSRAPSADLPIPGYPYDFGTLIAAQAIGDHQSLESHGRRVLRIAVDEDILL
ncbi:MAG: transaldolase / glucose-6-phosphate isomerase [Acidimicrobiaceae bacterium]|nr:transaldolase / glucose-6-phosphate isomerase [Acidimicrobiaceae bacterium]